jgi:hypothetical protein
MKKILSSIIVFVALSIAGASYSQDQPIWGKGGYLETHPNNWYSNTGKWFNGIINQKTESTPPPKNDTQPIWGKDGYLETHPDCWYNSLFKKSEPKPCPCCCCTPCKK